jgi:hypothetical protein
MHKKQAARFGWGGCSCKLAAGSASLRGTCGSTDGGETQRCRGRGERTAWFLCTGAWIGGRRGFLAGMEGTVDFKERRPEQLALCSLRKHSERPETCCGTEQNGSYEKNVKNIPFEGKLRKVPCFCEGDTFLKISPSTISREFFIPFAKTGRKASILARRLAVRPGRRVSAGLGDQSARETETRRRGGRGERRTACGEGRRYFGPPVPSGDNRRRLSVRAGALNGPWPGFLELMNFPGNQRGRLNRGLP